MKYFMYTMVGILVFSALATIFIITEKKHGKNQDYPTARIGNLELRLEINPKTITPGDTSWFVLWVVNRGQEIEQVNLPTPEPARFVVYRNNKPVWRSDYGMMFAQVITPFRITPGDSVPLKSFWVGKDNKANFLQIGKYIVEGCFLGTGTCLKDSVYLVD